mmetsp:Transcript_44252/g.117285  ORF Transcript_44252/g.117285 Transcript_44252/m.117285 type:complete len:392 (+) Transcript_44252:825-2000(+)
MFRGLLNVTLNAFPLHRMADARVVFLFRRQRDGVKRGHTIVSLGQIFGLFLDQNLDHVVDGLHHRIEMARGSLLDHGTDRCEPQAVHAPRAGSQHLDRTLGGLRCLQEGHGARSSFEAWLDCVTEGRTRLIRGQDVNGLEKSFLLVRVQTVSGVPLLALLQARRLRVVELVGGGCDELSLLLVHRLYRRKLSASRRLQLLLAARPLLRDEDGLLLVRNEFLMAALPRTLRGPQLFQVTRKSGIHLGKNADDSVQLRSVVRIRTDKRISERCQQRELLLRQGIAPWEDVDGCPHEVPSFRGLKQRWLCCLACLRLPKQGDGLLQRGDCLHIHSDGVHVLLVLRLPYGLSSGNTILLSFYFCIDLGHLASQGLDGALQRQNPRAQCANVVVGL